MKNKFYITTPIYYVNDVPHIGHAYTTIVADTLARFHRQRGREVFFSVGVDENSQKNVAAMRKAGESDLSAYLDRMASTWKSTWDKLDIKYDSFVRTTSQEHAAGVERFWNAAVKSGDIYDGLYHGMYCVGCEAFKTETELIDDRCPLHPNGEIQKVSERNYFFRASKYRDALLRHIEKNPAFIQPESRRNEVRRYIEDSLEDFSVSREAKNLEVGIPVPGDETQRIYVWFDALINYLTVVGYPKDEQKFSQWWPADLHLVGKDIIKFHCALWPAMLMSAAQQDESLRNSDGSAKLPSHVFAHGFFTINGRKISKSLGNAVSPLEFVEHIGKDPVRYYLLRGIPFGDDGDFSNRIHELYEHDLANTLGNLVNRAVSMSIKYFEGRVSRPKVTGNVFAKEGLEELTKKVSHHFENFRVDLALDVLWNGVDGKFGLFQANKFIEDTQPFRLIKTDREKTEAVLYSLLEYCRVFACLVEPALPETASKILLQLGIDPQKEHAKEIDKRLSWGGLELNEPLPAPTILFPRKEPDQRYDVSGWQ